MSGGGGGSYRPDPVTPKAPKGKGGGDGNDGDERDPCILVEETLLNSPVPRIVKTLKPDQELQVVLQVGPPVRVLIQTADGETAGSITGARLPQIIKCMEAGVEYGATVISIKEGAVLLRVANK